MASLAMRRFNNLKPKGNMISILGHARVLTCLILNQIHCSDRCLEPKSELFNKYFNNPWASPNLKEYQKQNNHDVLGAQNFIFKLSMFRGLVTLNIAYSPRLCSSDHFLRMPSSHSRSFARTGLMKGE